MSATIPTGPEISSDGAPLPPGIANHTEMVYHSARRHSRLVKLLKFGLPLTGCLIIAGLVGFVMLPGSSLPEIDVSGVGVKDGKLVMANPKLDGQTKSKLPYNMTAARAIQDLSNTNIISLEEIDAKFALNSEVTAVIDAERGIFDNTNNTLDINSPLNVKTSSGMVAKLKSAQVDLKAGNLKTQDPVDIDLNGSHIAADSLTVTDQGNVLVFEKRVRVTISKGQLRSGDGQ